MTHWTELPRAIEVDYHFVATQCFDAFDGKKTACPTCKNVDWKVLKEWGYYERTGIGACKCGTKFTYYG